MRIMHVCKKYPETLGGDATVVAHLERHQAESNSVSIVTSNCDEIKNGPHIYKFGLKDTAASLDNVTLRRLVSLAMLFFYFFIIIRKERPDIIHTHSVDMAFVVSFAARIYRVPIVHTFHIVTFYDQSQMPLRRKTELWLLKQARPSAVTAPNRFDVEKLRAAGVEQAVLLPNGVDLAFWRPALRIKANPVFTFLAVGRIEHQKGYEYLIRAAALLVKETATPFKVVIVGEGSQKNKLSRLVHSLQMEHIFEFVGLKSPKETHSLLAAADAAVCPSLYETTPLTLLEAWSMAVPIIITQVGILRDTPAQFNAAFVVPPQDSRSLMHAMKQCMSDPITTQDIAISGYTEAKKYDWQHIAQSADAIYRGAQ